MAKKIQYKFPGRVSTFFFLSVIWLAFSTFDGPPTDLEKLRLNGKVKSLHETRINEVQPGDSAQSGEVTYKKLSKFSAQGFESEKIIYNNNGKSSKIHYVFDSRGYPVGLKEYTETGDLWLNVLYILDEEGNKLEAEFDWTSKRGYDEIREKSEQLYELLDRNPWDRIVYDNDYRGFHLEEKYMKANGTTLFRFTFKYDLHGNKVEMIYFNSKGRTSWETKYKYDRNNQLVKSIIYKSNRVAAVSTYTYKYDAHGNWVNRLEKRDVNYNILTANLEEGNFLTKREIEYYPE
jgi:hypothetical protein